VRQLRLQQRLDRATLVHRAVALGDLRQRQHQVEHLAWIDRSIEDLDDGRFWTIFKADIALAMADDGVG
jgi:hypothetical protein